MPRYAPGQIVDDLVYFNSDNSSNYEDYEAPPIEVKDLEQQQSPVTKT